MNPPIFTCKDDFYPVMLAIGMPKRSDVWDRTWGKTNSLLISMGYESKLNLELTFKLLSNRHDGLKKRESLPKL
jgi:hypothetical protein